MPKASRDALGSKGKRDAPTFDPDDLILVTDKKSPLYDERIDLPYDEAMVLNMMYVSEPGGAPQGVIEPLIVRRNQETGKIEVVDGRQRVKAAREANKRLRKQGLDPILVTAMVERGKDARLMGMLISANAHRLEETLSGRAQKAQRYIDLGRDPKDVAVLLGTSEATVKNLLHLLDAPAAIRNAADTEKISAANSYKLARMEPEEGRKKLAELLEKAPRTPGKKRSKNAVKAREIMNGGKPKSPPREQQQTVTNTAGSAQVSDRGVKKIEDATAEAIAAWIETSWGEGKWNGTPSAIPALIRGGEWRTHRTNDTKEAEVNGG